MHRHRGVECDRDRRKLPEAGMNVDADGQGIERDIAKRVVDEMADQIAEQHQPAHQSNLPDADAAEQFSEPGLKGFGHIGTRIASWHSRPMSRPGDSRDPYSLASMVRKGLRSSAKTKLLGAAMSAIAHSFGFRLALALLACREDSLNKREPHYTISQPLNPTSQSPHREEALSHRKLLPSHAC